MFNEGGVRYSTHKGGGGRRGPPRCRDKKSSLYLVKEGRVVHGKETDADLAPGEPAGRRGVEATFSKPGASAMYDKEVAG